MLLPRRWIVERSLAWILHARRLVRDYERLPVHAETMVNRALIILMSRRLARPAAHLTAAAVRPTAALQAA
ncbi:hypothetical protein FHS40_008045 [Streptomyces spectabilis]|uniref:Transposase DDE domain-containing protein n=1 Tax=Streptomyces spectabilis TaxID=68270 RepID=A0A7W8B217_STRST|nr:hypothetical protein [Streptomyces spectabilis]